MGKNKRGNCNSGIPELDAEAQSRICCSKKWSCDQPCILNTRSNPDGVTECPCCDKGLVEVKCPYKHVNTSPCEVKDQGFYLKSPLCGSVSFKDVKLCTNSLIRSSKYYYQVQGQIAICEAGHCGFVCWTPKGLHIERVLRDQPFIEEMLQKLNVFFMNVILPELMTRCLKDRDQNNNTVDIICVCGKAENYDDMIACKSGHCKVVWYHLKVCWTEESSTEDLVLSHV